MKNPFLIGEAIYLRSLERSDASTVQPWMSDPEIRRTLAVCRPFNLQAEEAYIDRASEDPTRIVFLIVHRELDQPIGVCGLENIDLHNRHAKFGISIGVKEFWGKGIGTEATGLVSQYAFETLNLHRLCLHVYEFNERAMRSYARVGYRPEGILREEIFREGRYWNTVVMGLLRSEWEANRAANGNRMEDSSQ